MFRNQILNPGSKKPQRWQEFPGFSLIVTALYCSAVISTKAAAHNEYESVGLPEAHFWEEQPGYRSAKPQATVTELLGPKPLAVSVERLHHMQQWDQRDAYRLLTDAQQARRDAERETAASRIGESKWHYGWGVGVDDVKFRLSYDF